MRVTLWGGNKKKKKQAAQVVIAFTLLCFPFSPPVSPLCMQMIINVHGGMRAALHAICCVSPSEWGGGTALPEERVCISAGIYQWQVFGVWGCCFFFGFWLTTERYA